MRAIFTSTLLLLVFTVQADPSFQLTSPDSSDALAGYYINAHQLSVAEIEAIYERSAPLLHRQISA